MTGHRVMGYDHHRESGAAAAVGPLGTRTSSRSVYKREAGGRGDRRGRKGERT
jgi:hypothetical protein